VSLPISKSAAKTASLPIQKSVVKTASLPISGSKKLRRCRFRKSTAKTVWLPIQEISSATANSEIGSATANSEIGSENCVAVDSGNRQRKLLTDGGVINSIYIYILLGVYILPPLT
jgi:hypothetical protein